MNAVSANRLELIQIADAVAREKTIDRALVIEAMEDALARAARSRYGHETLVKAEINPATGEVFAQSPNCSRAQLDDAMAAASAALKGWRRDEQARRAALLRCAEAITARAGDLAGVRQEWESYERVIVADAWSDGEPAPKLLALRHELLTSPA